MIPIYIKTLLRMFGSQMNHYQTMRMKKIWWEIVSFITSKLASIICSQNNYSNREVINIVYFVLTRILWTCRILPRRQSIYLLMTRKDEWTSPRRRISYFLSILLLNNTLFITMNVFFSLQVIAFMCH